MKPHPPHTRPALRPRLPVHHGARVFGLWVVLCGCLCLSAVPAAANPRQVILQLNWYHQFEFAGYYTAIEQGFYAEAGLDVKIHEGGPGITPLTELLKGNADFCVGGSEMLLAHLRGQPVIALAAIFQHSAAALLMRADSGIYTPQDLAGRIVEMGSLENDAEIYALLMGERISPDKIIRVPSSFSTRGLIERQVDATSSFLSNQPFRLKEQAIPYRLIRPMWYGVDFYGDSLFTTRAMGEQHPDVVRAFVRASLKGWTYALAHPDQTIRVILDNYPAPNAPRSQEHLWFEYQETKKLIMPSVIEIGHINPGRLRYMADTFVQLRLSQPGYSLDGFLFPLESGLRKDSWQVRLSFLGVLLLAFLAGAFAYALLRLRKQKAALSLSHEEAAALRARTGRILEQANAGYWEWNMSNDTVQFDSRAAGLLDIPGPVTETTRTMLPTEIEVSDNKALQGLHEAVHTALNQQNVRIRQELPPTAGGKWLLCVAELRRLVRDNTILVSGILLDITAYRPQGGTRPAPAAAEGPPSRSQFFQKAEEFLPQMEQGTSPLSIALLRIDQFRTVRDSRGHTAANNMMRDVAMLLESMRRPQDILTRFGEDEFAILLPDAPIEMARLMLENVRDHLQNDPISVAGTALPLSFSAGVADSSELNSHYRHPRALIAIADKRLHAARHSGKQNVIYDSTYD